MEKLTDLKHLLQHEVEDLISAEDQILAALPKMIDKASDGALKNALSEHLKVTEGQRARLDTVQQLLVQGEDPTGEKKGLLARLFTTNHRCKGTQGIIEEGEKLMKEDMDANVMDAAIIACAQKIEHYEICGYGTARAFAEELGMREVEGLLRQTLDEEYAADTKLTHLAVGRLNKEAEGKLATREGITVEPAAQVPAAATTRKTVTRTDVTAATGKTSNAAKSGGRTANTPVSRTAGGKSTNTSKEKAPASGRKASVNGRSKSK